MKKIFNFSVALLALALGFVACSDDDDDYKAGVPTSTQQVFFSNTLSASIEISPSGTSFQLPINRGNSAGELTVPLKVTIPEGSIFSAPSEVKFADGSGVANLEFSYDPTKIEYGKYDTITVAIADASLSTQYGLSSITFTAGVTAWKAMEGKGYYREDFLSTFWGVDNIVVEAEFEENFVVPGMYRLKNVYGADYPYNDPGDWDDTKDYYITINATDPNAVYIEKGEVGINWSYGMISMWSMAGYMINKGSKVEDLKVSNPEYFGTLKDGLVIMPASSLLISMTDYKDGAWYPSNEGGKFAIALPGHVIADYSVSFEKTGYAVNDDKTEAVRGILTMSKDLESVKYAIAASTEDGDSIFAGIKDGSVNATTLTATAQIEAIVAGSGAYVVYVVGYANGEVVLEDAISFTYQSPFESWKAVGNGTYYYTLADLTADENGENGYGGVFDEYVKTASVLYQCEQNANYYRIAPWCDSETEGMRFTMNDNGIITVAQNYTGYTDPDYGEVYAADIQTYGAADIPSGYDAKNNMFIFYLAYYDVEGAWGYVADAFVPDPATSAMLNSQRSLVRPFKMNKAAKMNKMVKLKKKTRR